MSYAYLKGKGYYEDLYDRMTVEDARRGMTYYDNFLIEFEAKLAKDDKIERPGNAVLLNMFYMQTVGDELLRRYQMRDERINEWMTRDESKDAQIASARLSEEPYCHHCGKQALRIIDKSLMHRGESYDPKDSEEILFMLRCSHCDKNSAFWQDGTAWKSKPNLCPKCNSETKHTTSKTKKFIILTCVCPTCKHSYKDKLDLAIKEEGADSDFDKDRVHFCLADKEFRERLFEIRRGFKEMAALGKEFKEEDNKHTYDAMSELKKPKITELTLLLSPSLEKAGYTEFSLDKPEIGRDVYVGFSCLDSRAAREDHDSRKTLQKIIKQSLEDTNWRLMSDGISYRLGYLSGRLRAYEREEDIKELVIKNGKLKHISTEDNSRKNAYTIRGKDGKRIIL